MVLRTLRNKKAGLELSMSTIIVIVLSVVFLILGLALLRTIYGSATSSISTIDEKLKTQLLSLFADETKNTFIKPDDGQIKVRSDTQNFGFIIGARTKFGNDIKAWSEMQYRLILDKTSKCYVLLGETAIKRWMSGSKMASSDADKESYNNINGGYDGDRGFARIQLDIPKGTPMCTQTVFYDFIDKTNSDTQSIGAGAFTVQILRQSLI